MTQSRFVLQTKIIIIFALAVVSVVGVSTSIAMLLTRQLVEEEIYSKACTQARSRRTSWLTKTHSRTPPNCSKS